MTAAHSELIIRPIAARGELGLFCQIPYVLNEELSGDLDSGHRRPEWLWMAVRGDRLLARAGWWKMSDHAEPRVLDIFDIDDRPASPGRLDIGARLLREATAQVIPPGARRPGYSRFVRADWREQAASRRAVQDRMTAAERTGARLFVERLRLEWRPGTPIPAPTGRLTFSPVSDQHALITLMTAVMDGTLDAHGRRDLTRMTAEQAATAHYQDELAQYRSPREWWRIAHLPGGAPVGFVIPAHNGYNPIIAYIGVLPGHRGRGYIDEILAEGTRILAAQDVSRIRASTDLGNVPMASAFRRAGWDDFGHEITMTWDR